MAKSKISQGSWTRIRPLQRDELDPYTQAGMVTGELTWGGSSNNLCKVMAYLPRMLQTEVEYCNSFIFDPPTFRGGVQEAGFNDRFIKELAISKTSLVNRARYSVTHHSMIGINLFKDAAAARKGIRSICTCTSTKNTPSSTPSGRWPCSPMRKKSPRTPIP